MSKAKKVVVYTFDPLCGWCYGIADVLQSVLTKLENKIELELKLGGLFILEAAKPYDEFERHINTAQVRLKEVTGKTLSQSFLSNILHSKALANSSTPNQFLLDLQKTKVDSVKQLKIASELQRLHYEEGMDFNKELIYEKALHKLAIEGFHFTLNTDPMDISMELMEEYRTARDLGGYGFPAFFVKKGNNHKHLPHSYDEDELLKILEEVS